jgi:hypothetical protein
MLRQTMYSWPGAVPARAGDHYRYADAGVEAAPYPRRDIPVTTHDRPRALPYKATIGIGGSLAGRDVGRNREPCALPSVNGNNALAGS